ncbi:hypothetical protein [Romboutsia sp.]|uniref:hypothetical protein n=1 Tax=Romboutsia sp. TaxID=1965302 RepID=UPI002C4A3DDA|nr:hypothetical protein [Romboutsia sp.]HSQ90227.1 hypothetical protein [Romboutsia sp.]
MYLPCDTCKFKRERKDGFRTFVGCIDKEKEKGFKEDNYFYIHSCSNYEKIIDKK